MKKEDQQEVLRLIDELESTLKIIPEYEEELICLNEKMDINNNMLYQILDYLIAKKEMQ